ncbi:MAG: hypothetical protein ABSA65_11380 [Acidimicrobiales bacterium]
MIWPGNLAITAISQDISKQYVASVDATAHHPRLAISPSYVLGFSKQPANYLAPGLLSEARQSQGARATVVESTCEPRSHHIHAGEHTVEPHQLVRHLVVKSVCDKPTNQRPIRSRKHVLRGFVAEYFKDVQHLRR